MPKRSLAVLAAAVCLAAAGPAAPRQDAQDNLKSILHAGAEYCRRLSTAAISFACRQRIRETVWGLRESTVALTVISADGIAQKLGGIGKGKPERHSFLADYLLVKRGDRFEEKREFVEVDGKPVSSAQKPSSLPRAFPLEAFFVPIEVLGERAQADFEYEAVDEERIFGRRALIVRAARPPRIVGRVNQASLWLDRETGQVLKTEIEYASFEGALAFAEESRNYNRKYEFLVSHSYRLEKNGVRFPSETTFRVVYYQEYATLAPPPKGIKPRFSVPKAEVVTRYSDYRFFNVEVESMIKSPPSVERAREAGRIE